MAILSRLRPRLTIPVCALVIGGGFALAEAQPKTAITISPDAVWVYYTSLCARPGDASECTVVQTSQRPTFGSHQACSAHRDSDLGREPNPRLMGSCQKQHEA